jgi:hypothetical protein
MLSDGALEPAGILKYSDEYMSRINYVKHLFCSALGAIDTKVYTDVGIAPRLRFPAVIGRVLHRWGMPMGDKFMHAFCLPDEVQKGSIRVRCAYLKEVIPEDGSFAVYGKKRIFRIGRSVVLDAGEKSKHYSFIPKITDELKEVFLRLAVKNPQTKNSDTVAHYEKKLTWGRLKKASQPPQESFFAQKITELQKLVIDNPPELLVSEKNLLASLGIRTRIVPRYITLYHSSRISVSWELMTRGRNEAIKWALLALPSSGYKQKNVEDWLSTMVEQSDVVQLDQSSVGGY